jgi:hypothetical protein
MSVADGEIDFVESFLRSLDPDGTRTARVLRSTIDQLYDGQHTGRYCWDQLYKTEKTHCGTLVEINLQREFRFDDGVAMDFRIGGIEVDCKYSQRIGGWMIPPEARDHICMLVSAFDGADPVWSFGLVRTRNEWLNAGGNRDSKATLNDQGRSAIRWIWRDAKLPPNVLLQMPEEAVKRIMEKPSGSKRVNELFRLAQGRIVRRAIVATVAQQEDYMKRVRANGGARTALRKEGIIILGQYDSHAKVAKALNLPVPGPGDSVSTRVVPAEGPGPGIADISGSYWRTAGPLDPVVAAPDLPCV